LYFVDYVFCERGISSFVMSQIIESSKFSCLSEYVDGKTLVIFDIDNTLIKSTGYIGSAKCEDYMLNTFQRIGLSKQEAIKKEEAIWVELLDAMQFGLCERDIADVFTRLLEKNITIMGLTARPLASSSLTTKQMRSMGISFEQRLVYDRELLVSNDIGFIDGVLYVGSGVNKGEVLLKFLDQIGVTPEKVLFIDDSRKNLEHVCEALKMRQIPGIYIHYNFPEETESFGKTDPEKEVRDALLQVGYVDSRIKELGF